MNRNVFVAVAALVVFWGCGGRSALKAPKAAADDPYARLAAELAAAGRGLGGGKVAVLPFSSADPRFSGEGRAAADGLSSALAACGIQAVEQGLVSQALGGAGLEPSSVLSPAAIKDLGVRLGAGAIVTGTLTPLSDGGMAVKTRLIATGTVSILTAAETVLPPAGGPAQAPAAGPGGQGAGVLVK